MLSRPPNKSESGLPLAYARVIRIPDASGTPPPRSPTDRRRRPRVTGRGERPAPLRYAGLHP